MVFEFVSTSKSQLPGSGIAGIASSRDKHCRYQEASDDFKKPLAMIRLTSCGRRLFKGPWVPKAHMEKQADLIRPKFELC